MALPRKNKLSHRAPRKKSGQIQNGQLYSDGSLEIARHKKKHTAQQVKKQSLETALCMQTKVVC